MAELELKKSDFTQSNDPIKLFDEWLAEAAKSEINDPNALSLATVDAHGMPNVRMVLLKGFDKRGFVFYTNFEGTKGQEILSSMKAAMGFHWKTQLRQVRVRGDVEIVSDEEADEYYASRARGSRIGAWVSNQSRPLESRAVLEKAVADFNARHPEENIQRPAYWSGFRIKPVEIEFWQDGEFRLHDRVKFIRDDYGWTKTRLYP
jgi:pyridoxamine 5'-phosphate oxidase